MTATSSPSASAMSAYAPIRRNSFLQHPETSLSKRLSTFTLGLTLLIIRFWKDARLWQDVIARLPLRLQVFLRTHLKKWQGSTAEFVTSIARRLLQGLQEQLSPFLYLSSPLSPVHNNNDKAATATTMPQQPNHARTLSGDAPTSILCDLSSTQVTNTFLSTDYYEDRIRQNQCLIRQVLHYWFGQYEPDQAQKKLWMIASSSTQLRTTVDAEIAELFTSLLCELATAATTSTPLNNSNKQRNNDGTLQPCRWKQWCADKDMYGYGGKLAAIVVLDQFSRHIRRHYQQQPQQHDENVKPTSSSSDDSSCHSQQSHNNTSLLPPQEQLDSLAYQTSQWFMEDHGHEIHCGMIPLPQYIFGLMPYRHANTIESVQYVQTCVEQVVHLQEQFDTMTSRFRKATNRRMAVLQDEARRQGKATIVDKNDKSGATNQTATDEHGKEEQVTIESPGGTCPNKITDEDILETFPFEADMTDALDHPVIKTIQAFLADRGMHSIASHQMSKSSSNRKQKKHQKSDKKPKGKHSRHKQTQQPTQTSIKVNTAEILSTTDTDKVECTSTDATTCSVIVSLSGGVDSMVIASVLAYLKKHGGYPHLDIVAIHIDYANRPESKAESDYVENYCAKQGIRFVVRRIEEVTRGITARDEYEQRARQVRYDMYRKVAQDCVDHHQQEEKQKSHVVGVMLGHHRGDLRENVLSNAHKGCGPLDLSGMTAVSQNDGVTIYRPLLPLEKRDIFDYAHRYGVPYFKGKVVAAEARECLFLLILRDLILLHYWGADTTPHWSTRGKLRNKLLPLLEEIYGEGSMNNLSNLATESDECRALLHDALLKPFIDRVVRTPMGIIFETAPFVAQARGLFFWKFVLREVLHSAGLGMFSDKSVISFLERINPSQTYKKTIREGWLQCRRDYAVYLQADGKVFVFYPDSFPWRKSEYYACIGQSFDLRKMNTVAVGPWIVEAEVCDVKGDDWETLIKRKAVASMAQFMEGFVEYYLEVPTLKIEQQSGASDTAEVLVPTPLVFISSFRKSTRPPAWKNTDEKIQEVLPVLGISDESLQEVRSPTDDSLVAIVRVTLDRRFVSD